MFYSLVYNIVIQTIILYVWREWVFYSLVYNIVIQTIILYVWSE